MRLGLTLRSLSITTGVFHYSLPWKVPLGGSQALCKKADYPEITTLGGNPRESCGKVTGRGRGGEDGMPIGPYLLQPVQVLGRRVKKACWALHSSRRVT